MKLTKLVSSAAVLIIAGGLMWFSLSQTDEAPDTPDSAAPWRCRSCDNAFELTAAATEREQNRSQHPFSIYCPRCDKLQAYRVIGCPNCGTLFFRESIDGSSGNCPVCTPQAPRDRDDLNELDLESSTQTVSII